MNKTLFLHAFVLVFYAASSQAKDESCIDIWERDHTVNYAKCTNQEKPAQAKIEYSSCIDEWERDHSANLKDCTQKQKSANGASKSEPSLTAR